MLGGYALGRSDGIAGENKGARETGKRGRSAGAGKCYSDVPRKLFQLWLLGTEAPRRHGCDHHEPGLHIREGILDRGDRRVRPEVRDQPAAPGEDEAEDDQREVVKLTGSAREDSLWAGASTPATSESEEPPT